LHLVGILFPHIRRQRFALKKVDFDSYRQLYEFKFWQRRCAVASSLLPPLSSSALRLSTHFHNLMGI